MVEKTQVSPGSPLSRLSVPLSWIQPSHDVIAEPPGGDCTELSSGFDEKRIEVDPECIASVCNYKAMNCARDEQKSVDTFRFKCLFKVFD